MYDILELKSKLLTDLQDIAKNLNVPKYRSLKKMDLIYQILDVQAINPKATKENKINSNTSPSKSKPKPNQNIKPNKPMEATTKNKENSSTSKNEKTGHNETLKPKERVMRPRRKNETQLDRIKKAEKRDSETKEQKQPKKAV
jgi:transcription termination factor Rho